MRAAATAAAAPTTARPLATRLALPRPGVASRPRPARAPARPAVTVAGLNNAATNGAAAVPVRARRTTDAPRLAIPSKGRMAEDTLQLLRDCQLNVYKPNPRQYTATIPALPGVEVWFQRASDVVRKLVYGDVDLGIVG